MNISTRSVGSARVVCLEEDLTEDSVREFAQFLDKLIDEGAAGIVVDLSHVSYVTSRGLGAIVSAYTVLRKRGGNLVLVQPQPEVRKLLELTRLDRILDLAQSENEALTRVSR